MPDQINEKKVVNLRESNLGLIKVYTDVSGVRENLSDKKFCFVDEMFEADIIFMRKHHKDYKSEIKNIILKIL